jgi:hypothetical protein
VLALLTRFRMKCRSGSLGPKKWPPKQTEDLCSHTLTSICSHTLTCICHDFDPCVSFFVLSKERLKGGWVVAPAYVSSVQVSEGMQNYTSVQYRGTTVGDVAHRIGDTDQRLTMHLPSTRHRKTPKAPAATRAIDGTF